MQPRRNGLLLVSPSPRVQTSRCVRETFGRAGRMTDVETDVGERRGAANPATPRALPVTPRSRLRHPMERRVSITVAILDLTIAVAMILLLLRGAEWLEARPRIGQYTGHGNLLLIAVLGAPVVAIRARRRHRQVALEEGIHVGPTQLPELHRMLVAHCARCGIPEPELYVSDGVEHTTTFSWKGHQFIILSTHEFLTYREALDDIIDFVLAREVGSICLGYTSRKNDLLASLVAPIPFLRAPLNQVRTLSRDRYGAFLAPTALRALVAAASGDRLLSRVNIEAYLAQVDATTKYGFLALMNRLLQRNVPLAFRIRELRSAGILHRR